MTNDPSQHEAQSGPISDTSAAVTVLPSVRLALTMDDAPDPVLVTKPTTYTITVTNNGLSTAHGVILSDTLPANVTGVSVIVPDGVTLAPAAPTSGGTFSASGLDLASGASAVFLVSVKPDANAGASVTNTASVTGYTEAPAGFVPISASQTTKINPLVSLVVDVSATAKDASGVAIDPATMTARVHGTVTYTVTVANHGPSGATNVVLTNILPQGVTVIDGPTPQGSAITQTFASLAKDATATLTFTVRVNQAGPLVDTASVTAAEPEDDDPANLPRTSRTLTLQAQDVGGFLLDQSSYRVDEISSQGYLRVSVSRSAAEIAAGVTVAVSDGTGANRAIHGVNYGDLYTRNAATNTFTGHGQAVALAFAAGETAQDVYIPILDDLVIRRDPNSGALIALPFNLTLSNPTGGAVLSSPATSTATIIEGGFARRHQHAGPAVRHRIGRLPPALLQRAGPR